MMPRPTFWAALAVLLAGAPSEPAHAQDLAGAWALSYTSRDGVKMASTLTLKSDDGKLTGSIASARGTIALDEVSVRGNEIAFAITRVGFGDRIRIEYTGTVQGDSMRLRMKIGAREPVEISAKRGG